MSQDNIIQIDAVCKIAMSARGAVKLHHEANLYTNALRGVQGSLKCSAVSWDFRV